MKFSSNLHEETSRKVKNDILHKLFNELIDMLAENLLLVKC